MFKLIFQLAVVYLILQYGFKVDINGYIKPYIEPLISDAQEKMPESAKALLEKAEPLTDNAVVDYVSDRANAIGDAKEAVESLEQKMKEMQEAADKAADGDN